MKIPVAISRLFFVLQKFALLVILRLAPPVILRLTEESDF